jgi:hypothetical protein
MPMRHGPSYDTNRREIRLCLLTTLRCTKRSGSVRFLRKGHPLGGLRRRRFPASGDYDQSHGAPPAALATPTPSDNPISYGCINVPANFYNNVVSPAFAGTYGIVYVLPETRSISESFALYYDVE